MQLTVIILTFNSAATLPHVVASVRGLATRMLLVDSFSHDGTVELGRSLGCEVVQHEFGNYAQQRNWAQAQLAAADDRDHWVLHLDSDEVLSPELASSVRGVLAAPDPAVDGYLCRRVSHFLGRPIRFGYLNPSYHLRLFRLGAGFCEHRRYDQHYVVAGRTARLSGVLIDLQVTTLEQWTASHNRWSTAEAEELLAERNAPAGATGQQLRASLSGDIRMKRRWLKTHVWNRAPALARSLAYFLFSYIVCLGFLDGKAGLVYHVLQAFWFRFLIDAKICERDLQERGEITPDAILARYMPAMPAGAAADARPAPGQQAEVR